METNERKNSENKVAENCCDAFFRGNQGFSESMKGCCEGVMAADDGILKMAKCMKACRWFPLMPVVLGVVFLLLGYYLDPQITRVLWMAAAGFAILIGALGLLMMGKMKKFWCG
ncbi:MAG: hypothetical protein ACYTEL_01740 [Planctomycetota bacterium]|jgi:hypothetical protein